MVDAPYVGTAPREPGRLVLQGRSRLRRRGVPVGVPVETKGVTVGVGEVENLAEVGFVRGLAMSEASRLDHLDAAPECVGAAGT
jgi:hypothetical protein